MTRKKLKLAFIANDSSRKATFKKRKKGLMKKVNELSTLCGINACAIIYSPYDSNPEVWPSNSGVQRVVSEFRTLPEMDQHKKMVDQETFLKQRIAKADEHWKRQRKDNRELEMTEVMFQCLIGNMRMFHLNIMDLNDLGYMIEQYLKDINHRIEILRESGMEIGESSNVAAEDVVDEGVGSLVVGADLAAPAATMIHEVGSSSSSGAVGAYFNAMKQQQQQHLFRHPAAPHVGFYEQPRNLNLNQSHSQNQQQWFVEMMNHPEQMSYAAEQMSFPFMDNSHHNRSHHQHHHHHHHQTLQHQNLEDSSIAPTTNSSNSNVPVMA